MGRNLPPQELVPVPDERQQLIATLSVSLGDADDDDDGDDVV